MNLIFIAVIFCFLPNVLCKTYDILIPCTERDLCNGINQTYPRRWSRNFYDRNCFCDEACAEYGECCQDTQIRQTQPHRPVVFPYKCMETFRTGKVYVKKLCYRNWQNDYIKTSCENLAHDEQDIIKLLPVLDTTTNITYRNLYCAFCNNANSIYLKSWEMIISCPLADVFAINATKNEMQKILKRVKFNHLSNNWEVLIKRPNKSDYLLQCRNTYTKVSDALLEYQERFRSCKVGLVDTCASNWTDPGVRDKCTNGDTLYRYTTDKSVGKAYKNNHCAICNYVNPTSLNCIDSGYYTVVSGPRPDVIHFNLNFMLSQSGKALLNFECPNGQIYDEKRQKCRHVTCKDTALDVRGSCGFETYWYKSFR